MKLLSSLLNALNIVQQQDQLSYVALMLSFC